jgi:hypothetical protein
MADVEVGDMGGGDVHKKIPTYYYGWDLNSMCFIGFRNQRQTLDLLVFSLLFQGHQLFHPLFE